MFNAQLCQNDLTESYFGMSLNDAKMHLEEYKT